MVQKKGSRYFITLKLLVDLHFYDKPLYYITRLFSEQILYYISPKRSSSKKEKLMLPVEI